MCIWFVVSVFTWFELVLEWLVLFWSFSYDVFGLYSNEGILYVVSCLGVAGGHKRQHNNLEINKQGGWPPPHTHTRPRLLLSASLRIPRRLGGGGVWPLSWFSLASLVVHTRPSGPNQGGK